METTFLESSGGIPTFQLPTSGSVGATPATQRPLHPDCACTAILGSTSPNSWQRGRNVFQLLSSWLSGWLAIGLMHCMRGADHLSIMSPLGIHVFLHSYIMGCLEPGSWNAVVLAWSGCVDDAATRWRRHSYIHSYIMGWVKVTR